MRFLIPSYGRCGNVTTLDVLKEYGVSAADVTISTQTKEEYRRYSREYRACEVIYREARNVAGQLNTLLGTLDDGEVAFVMDDDLRSFAALVNNPAAKVGLSLVRAEAERFHSELQNMAAILADRPRSYVCTALPTDNTMNAATAVKADGPYSVNALSSMWLCAIRGGCPEFDETFDAKEDYELQLRLITQGSDVVRVNTCAPRTNYRTPNAIGASEGGRGFSYRSDKDMAALQRLDAMYRPFVKADYKRMKITTDRRFV